MRFARTEDPELIRTIVCHPKVWRWSAEEGSDSDAWTPVFGEGVIYVGAVVDRTLVALFVFERRNSVKWAVHLAIAPSQWARGVEAFKGAIDWAWRNIEGLQRLSGEIPADNKHALRLAKKAGFELVGTDRGAFQRGGLQDVHIVGLSRPEQVQEVAA